MTFTTIELATIVSAVATLAYAVLTMLLILEARASRISATVVARLTRGRGHGGSVDSIVRLENFGPAPATDVRMTLDYQQAGLSAASRQVWIPALGPGDQVPYLPAVLLSDESGSVPAIAELAQRKLVLEIHWEWRDGRRSLRTLLTRNTLHKMSVRVDLAEYLRTVDSGIEVIELDLVTVLDRMPREIRDEFEAQRRNAAFLEGPPDPAYPVIRADYDVTRFHQELRLWVARIRRLLRLRRPS